MLDSVRTRLTLWYTGVLALVLVAFSAGVYYLLANELRGRFDAGLRTTVEGIERLLVYEFAEGESEPQAIHSALNEHYFPNQAAAIFDEQGRLLGEKSLPNGLSARPPAGQPAPAETIRLFRAPDRRF